MSAVSLTTASIQCPICLNENEEIENPVRSIKVKGKTTLWQWIRGIDVNHTKAICKQIFCRECLQGCIDKDIASKKTPVCPSCTLEILTTYESIESNSKTFETLVKTDERNVKKTAYKVLSAVLSFFALVIGAIYLFKKFL